MASTSACCFWQLASWMKRLTGDARRRPAGYPWPPGPGAPPSSQSPPQSVFSQVQVKVSPYLVSTAFDPLGPPTEVPKELCFFEKKKLPRGNDEGRARQCGARRRCAAARSFRHWKRS